LYAHRDPALSSALTQGLQDRQDRGERRRHEAEARHEYGCSAMRLAARGTAKLMATDDGPRVAALAFDGWDTHANEGGPVGRLAQMLGGLDGAFAEFESGLGERWRDTADRRRHRVRPHRAHQRHRRYRSRHRHDRAARGRRGKGRARDCGLAGPEGREPLYEGRDLKPTMDVRGVLKGVLRDQSRPQRARAGGRRCFPTARR
jgi:uncharacterized protein (DUF1501 family)